MYHFELELVKKLS